MCFIDCTAFSFNVGTCVQHEPKAAAFHADKGQFFRSHWKPAALR